ncbi:protein of unknown function [Acidithiobacillus ferrivorans]|uniref:Uncharacterized protein n=1 Tax=Acidithiobacillus ferrivorans TaxID=160808 RepID=A0ABY1ML44_9PROT|nr:protein of unknown function [Acidithiobacillus ferrivorans]
MNSEWLGAGRQSMRGAQVYAIRWQRGGCRLAVGCPFQYLHFIPIHHRYSGQSPWHSIK